MALVVETHQNTGGSGGNSSLGGVRRSGVDHVTRHEPSFANRVLLHTSWCYLLCSFKALKALGYLSSPSGQRNLPPRVCIRDRTEQLMLDRLMIVGAAMLIMYVPYAKDVVWGLDGFNAWEFLLSRGPLCLIH